MMIILSAYSAMEKKKLPLSLIFVFGIFLSQQLFVNIENFSTGLPVLLYFAGGFFGCVFGFLSTPLKKRKKAT
jgi:predicted membrane protein